jgi:hypothetical protein
MASDVGFALRIDCDRIQTVIARAAQVRRIHQGGSIEARFVTKPPKLKAGLPQVDSTKLIVQVELFHTFAGAQMLCMAPAVIGKSDELVTPATYALPELSTAIPAPTSSPLPPR